MRVGLIDVDGHNFPNIPLMKLSAWHKAQGDSVEWYQPMFSGHMDRVYMSKVFSFSPDYEYFVDADEIIRGGSGYCIELQNGKEHYCADRDKPLPDEVEHIYPDYSIYPELTKDTAFGFLTRGCPRQCSFCHVKDKPADGPRSRKVADLSEFWHGQKNIVLCDPNLIACPDWRDLLQQLIDSKACVDINQGVDIRMMTEEKAEMIRRIRVKNIHFAFDRFQDWDIVVPKLRKFAEVSEWKRWKVTVYVLCNFDTNLSQDLARIYAIRECGFQPFVMLYNKQNIPREHTLLKLQRWVNNPWVFWSCERFEEYEGKKRNKKIKEEP